MSQTNLKVRTVFEYICHYGPFILLLCMTTSETCLYNEIIWQFHAFQGHFAKKMQVKWHAFSSQILPPESLWPWSRGENTITKHSISFKMKISWLMSHSLISDKILWLFPDNSKFSRWVCTLYVSTISIILFEHFVFWYILYHFCHQICALSN